MSPGKWSILSAFRTPWERAALGLVARGSRPVLTLAVGASLAGCPYVYGGPDYSNVDGTEDGPPPPVVAHFELVPYLDRLGLDFGVDEGAATLLGGTVTLSDGDDVVELSIPEDMEEFVPGGTSRATFQSWDLLDCEKGHSATWTLTVADADGVVSEPAEFELEIAGQGRFPEADQYDLGSIRAPWTACLQFDGATQTELSADKEDVLFEDPEGGARVVELGWQGSIDLDVTVFDWTPGAHQQLTSAYTIGDVWEILDVNLVPDTSYKIKTLFWGAQGGIDSPYEAVVLVRER